MKKRCTISEERSVFFIYFQKKKNSVSEKINDREFRVDAAIQNYIRTDN